MKTLRVGFFGIGLEAYWEQFDGLKARLEGYVSKLAGELETPEVKIINAGLIDSPDSALRAAHDLRQSDVDILFIYVTTYAVSSTVLPIVQHVRVPVVVLNLVPTKSIDYEKFNTLPDRTKMTGEWLAYCSACPVPEIANLFMRAGIVFREVDGELLAPDSMEEIREWVDAARVAKEMFHNRMGAMGHYYGGMLDIYSDLTKQSIVFGGHIEILEVDELSALKRNVTQEEIRVKLQEFKSTFDIQPDCSQAELERAATTAVALDKLVAIHRLGSLAYYYKGTGVSDNEDTMSSIILGTSLLTARNIPVAGEYEIKNVQAMKILDLFRVGGSFTEYYAVDYADDIVLMGHDGPGHIAIAQGKTKVKPLEVYHGKVGNGLSVEMSVKLGKVTLLSVVESVDGKLKLLCAEGESVEGPILNIGNTNSRYRFSIPASHFMKTWNSHGPAHHCAVGVGHVSGKLRKLASLLDMEIIQVC